MREGCGCKDSGSWSPESPSMLVGIPGIAQHRLELEPGFLYANQADHQTSVFLAGLAQRWGLRLVCRKEAPGEDEALNGTQLSWPIRTDWIGLHSLFLPSSLQGGRW